MKRLKLAWLLNEIIEEKVHETRSLFIAMVE